jgi:predicted metal-dependent phosphoesterase TrpH
MSEIYDLHCHSTASDGALPPAELVRRAHRQGVTALALTDHDTTAGLDEAKRAAEAEGLRFIPGIELSCQWQGKCLHIVGLGIDPAYEPLAEATHNLRNVRLQRAEQIALKLEKKRIPGALEAVKIMAGESMITRTHFADFLLSQGHVTSQQEAFDRYLAKGKAAYVATPWAEMSIAVDWIVKSGGVAVLAHPLRYQLTASWLRRLLNAFKEAGGQAVEVVTGRYNAEEIQTMANHAKRSGLAGSAGSDFHNPANQYVELGRLALLPPDVQPVWELL